MRRTHVLLANTVGRSAEDVTYVDTELPVVLPLNQPLYFHCGSFLISIHCQSFSVNIH